MIAARGMTFLDMNSKETYFTALEAIAESPKPIGAWNLRRVLKEKGLVVSKATAGRLLRSLEDNQHARAEGNVGRVITPEGKIALDEWSKAQARRRSHTAFEESLTIRGRKHLKDALIARRAIESETAYLAAANATEQDLQELRKVIEEHDKLLSSGLSGAGKDAEFHRILARSGENKVLMSALEVIHHNPQIGQVLEYIRSKMGSKMVEDHRAILDQVAKGDCEGAREAMTKHIAAVINDVDKYWAEIGKP